MGHLAQAALDLDLLWPEGWHRLGDIRQGDERAVLATWPVADDGWDESMPPSVGAADLALGGYVLSDEPRAMVTLGRQAYAVRTFSSDAELVAFDWPS